MIDMNQPQLRIELNKEFDKEICGSFINRQNAGVDFGKGIIKLHPNLTLNNISEYFDSYYKQHKTELLMIVDQCQSKWDGISDGFFLACDKYFGNLLWPKGEYKAYLSIINCNPRFLENKTFQVYWKHPDGFVYVAAHEMLHFLFFDLVQRLLPTIDINDRKIWEISEVFNGLIMREPEFVEITGVLNIMQYPDLAELQIKLTDVWEKNKNARKFILLTR